ncbi:ABC transporter substrate-binding protein [Streptomyces sp. NPDC085946]|uniref:ABC transporter substrate-binding protein n=1 Tax=Streptomyces sp. NPDC085946 TaxID=3365744 RepID=UPI0037D0E17F
MTPFRDDSDELFPDPVNARAEIFVSDYPTAVTPADPARLDTRPPLFVFRVDADGPAGEEGTRRVLRALRRPLDDRGPLVPYALVPATEEPVLLTEQAGLLLENGTPRHMTPDRYPHFAVVRSLVTHIRDHPQQSVGGYAEELRRHACDRQQEERRGLLGHLPRAASTDVSPDGGDLKGWLLKVFWLSFTCHLPRWIWSRRISRKVMRRWLGGMREAGGRRDLYQVMAHVAATQAPRLRVASDERRREQALQTLEKLLLRALLEDLATPRTGRYLPKRRRRTARPVLLVEVPPPGADGAGRAERFLRVLHELRDTAPRPGPLVIAVGKPSDALVAELGARESSLSHAATALGSHDGTPVAFTFDGASLTGPGLPIARVEPYRRFRSSWRTTTSLLAGAAALALTAGGIAADRIRDGGDHSCVGGTASVADDARARPVPLRGKGWYAGALKAITDQNRRAEAYAAQGRDVRTVVAFVSSPPRSEDDMRFDGTIPELRGIAMWQQQLNKDAGSDENTVPLRVEVRTTGEAYRDAVAEARKLVAEVRDEQDTEDHEKIVGVLAYAQSRDETRTALQVLGRAGIPTVGTTATANEMLAGEATRSYWPFTPDNGREARIEANFAHGANIVARHGDTDSCTPARRAVVIRNPADLYSRSLAGRFVSAFPGTTRVFDFNQEGDFGPQPPDGAPALTDAGVLAGQLCKALAEEPRSIVYWSARAKDFTAFISAMDNRGTCVDHPVTVLGGNELTNVAQTGAYANQLWLRLYYSAHRLPDGHESLSAETRQFLSRYDAFVKTYGAGADPWRQDGHSAVSYDAFHVLSDAVNQARSRDERIERRSVLITLAGGIAPFNGATGYIAYAPDVNDPPVDKTLVILRQLGTEPQAVLVCGAFDLGESSREQGLPCVP